MDFDCVQQKAGYFTAGKFCPDLDIARLLLCYAQPATHTNTNTHTHIRIHIQTHTHIHTRTHTHTSHTYPHSHTYTLTPHTHTNTPPPPHTHTHIHTRPCTHTDLGQNGFIPPSFHIILVFVLHLVLNNKVVYKQTWLVDIVAAFSLLYCTYGRTEILDGKNTADCQTVKTSGNGMGVQILHLECSFLDIVDHLRG